MKKILSLAILLMLNGCMYNPSSSTFASTSFNSSTSSTEENSTQESTSSSNNSLEESTSISNNEDNSISISSGDTGWLPPI